MVHNLAAYKNAIVEWNNNRSNAQSLLDLIAQGSYFEITRAMHDNWTSNAPDTIHAYLGVDTSSSPSIGFMLIDSVSDSNPETVTTETISYAPYCEGFSELQVIPHFSNAANPNNNISVLAGLERSFRWMLNRKKYIQNKVAEGAGENTGMFQAFHIPMGDLNAIFADENANKALVIIGLKEDNTTAELILWDENYDVIQTVEDTAFPIPPYHDPTSYSLLQMAL